MQARECKSRGSNTSAGVTVSARAHSRARVSTSESKIANGGVAAMKHEDVSKFSTRQKEEAALLLPESYLNDAGLDLSKDNNVNTRASTQRKHVKEGPRGQETDMPKEQGNIQLAGKGEHAGEGDMCRGSRLATSGFPAAAAGFPPPNNSLPTFNLTCISHILL